MSKKQLRTLFPKAALKQFRAALPPDERKSFDHTLDGTRMPQEGEVNRWLAALKALIEV